MSDVTRILSRDSDILAAIDEKADKSSPTFTGTVDLPATTNVEFNNVALSDILALKADKYQFSTTETDTGNKWLGGETIYRKVLDFGSLPNATNKSVNHNITGSPVFVVCRGFIKGSGAPIPNPIVSGGTAYLRITASSTQITIDTAFNYSASEAFCILEYYKTA